MEGNRWLGKVGWILTPLVLIFFSAASARGFYLDDRREMNLAGFLYSRGVFALQDGIAAQQNTYYAGNMVSHRNFLTLEWRHNLDRISREVPTLGSIFEFLDFDAFDYYLNMRTEYDGVYDYGPRKIRDILRGTRLDRAYFDDRRTPVPFDGLYFTPVARGGAPDFPADTSSLSNRRWMRDLTGPRMRLFEWYINLTEGPFSLRFGRQNLSWGETDAFRLLDQINPLDSQFGGFLTSLDERRIPLSMLKLQWSFGTIGPIQDLMLEGFYSIDDETNPFLPTGGTFFWGSPQNGNTPIMVGRTPCGGHFFAQRGIPALPELGYRGSGPGPDNGGDCSLRADGPHSNLEDGRGGGRIVGTIRDFTFSLAHYYTYQDIPAARATIISPTVDHLRWDLGLPTNSRGQPFTDNPWGPDDPVAARIISSGANATGRGGAGMGVVAAAERNLRLAVNYQRIQVTGGSLSFPLNALTGLFVGSDHPLFYSYTTIRSEVAYFRNYPTPRAYAHFDGGTAFNRFAGLGPIFGPGGPLADQAGRRTAALNKRDWLSWSIGVDHNQWIRWLNPNNSFTMSAQLFWTNRNDQDTAFDQDRPPSVLNDKDVIPARKRHLQGPVTDPMLAATCAPGSGARGGCSVFGFPKQDWLTTFNMSTVFLAGNLRPSFTFLYDWAGAYLIQPGIDWILWDPFRLSLRYNYIEGRGNTFLIGARNRQDNVWIELQYLFY